MKIDRQINDIVDQYAPDISSGQETSDSVIKKYPHYAKELKPRLEAIEWLATSRKNLQPRPGFIASSRAYLEDQAARQPSQDLWQRIFKRYTPQHWAFFITAPALIVILLALIFNSMVLTARLSIPGDPFYSTKLFIENAQLALTLNPVDKSELYFQFTKERTSELVDLVLDGQYEAIPNATLRLENEISSTIRELSYVPDRDRSGNQPETDQVKATLSNEIIMLSILKNSVPAPVASEINTAIRVAQTGLIALR